MAVTVTLPSVRKAKRLLQTLQNGAVCLPETEKAIREGIEHAEKKET